VAISVGRPSDTTKLGSVQLSVAEQASPADEEVEPVDPLGVDSSQLQR
jgi:hypothetical protein